MTSNQHTFAAYIPVRGGSKSIPLKNIKDFCGKPLVYWTIKAANDAAEIDAVYVATDSDLIRKTVEEFGFHKVRVINRGNDTVTDRASTESALLEFADNYDFQHVILIQATSPLLESSDLVGGIDCYLKEEADSLLSVVRQKRFIWERNNGFAQPVNYEPANRPRRQEWEGFLVENGAFYITSKKRLQQSKCRISGNIAVYEMPEDTYFEIDELSDWLIAENLKENRLRMSGYSQVDFKQINLLVTDVDGVLTDAGMYYSTSGEEFKKFNTRDGKGIELLRAVGIKVMFLTSENVELVRKRADKLKIDFLHMGIGNKKAFLDEFFANHNEFDFSRTAYIGDDINDLECIQASLFSATPADGAKKVKKAAKYNCTLSGGQGCVREVCDLILSRRQNG